MTNWNDGYRSITVNLHGMLIPEYVEKRLMDQARTEEPSAIADEIELSSNTVYLH